MFIKITNKPIWSVENIVEPNEYILENNDVLIIADLSIDKTKKNDVEKCLKDIASQYTSHGRFNLNNIFNNNYFICIVSKKNKSISMFRDPAGVKSGYYKKGMTSMLIGTNCHTIAKAGNVTGFNDEAVYMLIYLGYIFDGMTIYDSVHEVKIGQYCTFDDTYNLLEKYQTKINLFNGENDLSLKQNITMLREKIILVHKKHSSINNTVLLSGGVDSCVMLAALHEVVSNKDLHTISYRVKGTGQDETIFARKAAQYLGVNNTVVDVDPTNRDIYRNFEEKIFKMNNPYIGMWIFTGYNTSVNEVVFAGQDTRLHTPDVIWLDKIVFSLLHHPQRDIAKIINILMIPFQQLYYCLHLYNCKNKYIRNFDRVLYLFNFIKYIQKFFFKLNRNKLLADHVPVSFYDKIAKLFQIDYNSIKNLRELYNVIVSLKWQEQYTDDIRYMVDLGTLNNSYTVMPFYDPTLAEFSAGIPFNQATKYFIGNEQFSSKKTILNKYILREAFKDKLVSDVYFRQKSVSITNYLLFNGVLGEKVRDIIVSDIKSSSSFIERYGLIEFIQRYLSCDNWILSDQHYLLKIYYIAMLCMYQKNLSGQI